MRLLWAYLFFATSLLASAADFKFEYENMIDNFHNPAENVLKFETKKFFQADKDFETVGFYTYAEISKAMSRGQAGLIYRSTFGLNSNIGIGMSQDSYGFCGNLGISFESENHQADLQADIDSKLILRGYYDFSLSDKFKIGIYGRTHYGVGPRVTLFPTKVLSISWACAYDYSKPSDRAVASVFQLQVHL